MLATMTRPMMFYIAIAALIQPACSRGTSDRFSPVLRGMERAESRPSLTAGAKIALRGMAMNPGRHLRRAQESGACVGEDCAETTSKGRVLLVSVVMVLMAAMVVIFRVVKWRKRQQDSREVRMKKVTTKLAVLREAEALQRARVDDLEVEVNTRGVIMEQLEVRLLQVDSELKESQAETAAANNRAMMAEAESDDTERQMAGAQASANEAIWRTSETEVATAAAIQRATAAEMEILETKERLTRFQASSKEAIRRAVETSTAMLKKLQLAETGTAQTMLELNEVRTESATMKCQLEQAEARANIDMLKLREAQAMAAGAKNTLARAEAEAAAGKKQLAKVQTMAEEANRKLAEVQVENAELLRGLTESLAEAARVRKQLVEAQEKTVDVEERLLGARVEIPGGSSLKPVETEVGGLLQSTNTAPPTPAVPGASAAWEGGVSPHEEGDVKEGTTPAPAPAPAARIGAGSAVVSMATAGTGVCPSGAASSRAVTTVAVDAAATATAASTADVGGKRVITRIITNSYHVGELKGAFIQKVEELKRESTTPSAEADMAVYMSQFGIAPKETMPVSGADEEQYLERVGSLGDGKFGEVLRVRYKSTGVEYALKLLKECVSGGKYCACVEMKVLRMLLHSSFVVSPIAMDDYQPRMPILLELGECNMSWFLFADGITKTDLLSVLYDVVRGLKDMHDLGLVYGDLKADNIIVCYDDEGDFTAKLSDFGLTRGRGEPRPKRTGSIGYIPWENMIDQVYYEPSQDMFSLGVLIYTLLVKEDLREPNIFSSQDLLTDAEREGKIDMATVEMQIKVTIRTMKTGMFKSKMLQPANLVLAEPAASTVCEALKRLLSTYPSKRPDVGTVKKILESVIAQENSV